MKREWKNYKRKGDSHQRSHHEKYAYDERKDRNNDNPYVQDYTPETRTQRTEQSVLCVHEEELKQSRHIQSIESGCNWEDGQKGARREYTHEEQKRVVC